MTDRASKDLFVRLIDGDLDASETMAAAQRLDASRADRETLGLLVAERHLLQAALPTAATSPGIRAAAAAIRAARRPRPWRRFAALSSLAASALVAAAVSAGGVYLAGQWTAARIAASLDEARLAHLDRSTATALALEGRPSGTSVAWHEPAAGIAGAITPLRTFRDAHDRWCREYEELGIGANGVERRHVVACRVEGTWRDRERLPPPA